MDTFLFIVISLAIICLSILSVVALLLSERVGMVVSMDVQTIPNADSRLNNATNVWHWYACQIKY